VRGSARSSITALLVMLCALADARPAHAATQTAQVSANVLKPLIVIKLQDLDLGTITLRPGTWSNATVALTRAGAFSCANSNLTCTGATRVAQYNVEGSGHQTVRISAPNVTMVNQSDPTKTLTLVVDSPATLLLANSGPPGTNFAIGGSISLSSSTAAGTYVGTFNVTVDY
jgi:hypothetical protein